MKVGVLGILLLVSFSSIAVALLFMVPQNNLLFRQDSLTSYSAASLSLSNNVKNQSVSPSFLFSSSHSNTFVYPKDVLLYYYPNRNDSDVDNNTGIGYHSSFVNQQIGPDGIYDTLTEANTVNSSSEILFTNGPGNFTELNATSANNWQCCNSFDKDKSYVYTNSTQYEQDLYNMTKPTEGGIINWVSVGISVKNVRSNSNVKGDANIELLMDSNSFETSFINIPTSYQNLTVDYQQSPNTGDSWTWSELETLQAGVSLRLRGTPDVNDSIRCTFVWVEVNYTIPNYELDLEAQWTGIPSSTANSSLCIMTGSNSGNENLSVDYWTGSNYFMNAPKWVNLIPILYPNQWNNVSLHIDNSVFTIRFKDLNDTKDGIQDSWDIDVSLVAVNYNPQETYTSTLSLLLLGSFLLGGGGQPSLPSTALVVGSVALISVSGLAVRHFYVSGEEASLRRRRIKQLDESRGRIQKALEDDDSD